MTTARDATAADLPGLVELHRPLHALHLAALTGADGGAEAEAGRAGCDRVVLTVMAFNEAARGFYEALGYNALSHRMSRPVTSP
jgi:hypothetical protein